MNNPRDQKLDDVIKCGKAVFDVLLGARHVAVDKARERAQEVAEKIGLVGREEFDAAFAMLAKLRDMQDDINKRLQALEKQQVVATAHPKTKKSAPKTATKTTKPPESKQSKRRSKPV